MLAEAARVDAREDAELGDRRGDELPAELADPGGRRERLRQALEDLEREQAAEQASCQAQLDRREAWEADHGRKLAGRRPSPPAPDALEKRRANTTDPDTRLMKRSGGRAVQGYNAQAVATPGQIILAARVTQAHNDTDQLAPMVTEAGLAARQAGVEEPIETALADGGYWNPDHITHIQDEGIDVLIPPPRRRRAGSGQLEPVHGDHAQRMTTRLRTAEA